MACKVIGTRKKGCLSEINSRRVSCRGKKRTTLNNSRHYVLLCDSEKQQEGRWCWRRSLCGLAFLQSRRRDLQTFFDFRAMKVKSKTSRLRFAWQLISEMRVSIWFNETSITRSPKIFKYQLRPHTGARSSLQSTQLNQRTNWFLKASSRNRHSP